MKLAVIAPIYHLDQLCDTTDRCQFALAHLCDSKEYKNFYAKRANDGDLVMLDNGVYERGEPIDQDILLDLAAQMGVQEIVIPDYLRGPEKTWNAAQSFMDSLSSQELKAFDYMGVLQTDDPTVAIRTYKHFIDLGIKTIGFPRWTSENNSRSWIVKTVISMIPEEDQVAHHLLGCGDPLEVAQYNEKIRSVDTSFPCKWGYFMDHSYEPFVPPYYRQWWTRVPFDYMMTPQQVSRAIECRERIRQMCKRVIK